MDVIDWFFILGLVLLAILFTSSRWNLFASPPLEDAAIVLRYVGHLAAGHGIVWNLGDEPVDGTTDFLFLLVASGLVKAGLSPQVAARLWIVTAHCLTIGLVYFAIRQRGRAARWAAVTSAGYLAVGPALTYIWDAFATPVFALFASLTWWLAWKIKERGGSQLDCALFGLCALATALERPEGVFLAGFMLLALIFLRGLRRSRLAILYFLGFVGIGGGSYFLWHWQYFGYPLPNPFYIRGGGRLFPDSLRESMQNVLALGGPFALVYMVGLWSPRTVKLAVFSLIPVAGFASMWLLLSSMGNHYMRYQYAILPVVLLSWYPLWEEIVGQSGLPSWADLRARRCAPPLPLLAVSLFVLLILRGSYWRETGKNWWDSTYELGVMLGQFKDKHYTLATSEAGLVPFYSEWRTIDTWGLNNSWIAHHGTITESMLENENPEVIMFHCSFSPLVPPSQNPYWPFSSAWFSMVMTLKGYAEGRGYRLVGSYGSDPHDTTYIYVRPDFPDSLEITRRIGGLMDTWSKREVPLVNFARFAALSQ
jgi:hypothetical protein